MSRLDSQQGLMPSVLDRLIDPEADGSAFRHGYGIEQLVQAVSRDLEDLLNSRQATLQVPADCTEVLRSIVAYGLPDITFTATTTAAQKAQIGKILEGIVNRYEPRLRDVRAVLLDPADTIKRTLTFRIEARLCVEPAPEVAFDTILELATGHSTISQAGA
jgi:type VI secretion system protein ImpF